LGHRHTVTVRAIPHTLSNHLCIDFVNSHFTDHRGSGREIDRLDMAEWQLWFANRCGIKVAEAATDAEHRRLVALRDVLRPLLESRSIPADGVITELNGVLADTPQTSRLASVAGGIELRRVWQREDWPAVMAVTVMSYAQLLATREIDRIRVCSNADCTFLFHDETRNRSRRWCDASTCGNLARVRRHRAAP
jgi:predicted RNA-binding Zn ribbon-like protein